MIVFGTRMYGRVDEMPEGYVATQFFHIWFIPLFPIKSLLVTDDSNDRSVRGVSLGWSGKSILAAYIRTGGVLMALACLGYAAFLGLTVLDGIDHPFQHWDYYSQQWIVDWATLFALPLSSAFGVGGAVIVWGSYKLLGRASEERRRHLLASIRARPY